jgi:hypothetical protein
VSKNTGTCENPQDSSIFHLRFDRANVQNRALRSAPNFRGAKMIRRPIFSLVSLGAILGMLGTAQAGTSITYDWVTPGSGSGFSAGTHFSGSITVDSTGISSTPIDLTESMIQSWQISVFDSTNTLLFSLSSPTDVLVLEDDSVSATFETFAPEITTTSIFLPALPALSGGITSERTFFEAFHPTALVVPSIDWFGNAGMTSVTVMDSTGFVAARFSVSPNIEIEIAHNPEPASLVIWSLVAGVFGVWQIRKRRWSSVEAT